MHDRLESLDGQCGGAAGIKRGRPAAVLSARASSGCTGPSGAGHLVTEARPGLTGASLGLLFAVQCVLSIGNAGMFSAMPSIGRSIGIPDAAVTGMFSLSALLWVVCSGFWARMCDRYGLRSLILVGLAGFVVSMGAAGAVIHLALSGHFAPWTAFALLLTARAVFGGFGSAAGPASQAYAIERSSEVDRTRIISRLTSGMTTGILTGPLLAPVAIALWGPPTPFYLFAGLAAITMAAVAATLTANAPKRTAQDVRGRAREGLSIWRDPVILPYLIFALVAMTVQTAQAQTLGFLVIDVMRLPPVQAQPAVALVMALGALAALAGQLTLVRLRAGEATVLVGAALLTAFAAGLMAIADRYSLILFAFVAQSFGIGLARPAFIAAASLAARAEDQARLAGAFASINGVAMLVAPCFVLAYGLDRRWPFLLALVAMIGVSLLAKRFSPHRPV